jgi:hypothetical protein
VAVVEESDRDALGSVDQVSLYMSKIEQLTVVMYKKLTKPRNRSLTRRQTSFWQI